METFFIFAVGLLFALAIFDITVGVANDAVNFLNSAIGSKASSRRVILTVASCGILIGALSSAGMMEIARSGIYNPQYFYFNEVMVIFLTVMITDIILLDIFNTLGLPTSTTVSIIFELLGAAFTISVIKAVSENGSINLLFSHDNPDAGIIGYMNWDKAGDIIFGILISVIIAFSIGAIVQYISRLLFSFNYKRKMKYLGSIWAGIAFTAIFYFLIYKGLNSIISGVDASEAKGYQSIIINVKSFIDNYFAFCLIGCLILSTLIMYILNKKKINILKIVILLGTFSLAMAFAGNDLVNFIGVPIAGWQSFTFWKDSGVAPELFLMKDMAGKVSTPFYFLFFTGIIMVLTIWFSKKAMHVTDTEVSLGSQSDVDERFKPNLIARLIVSGGRAIGFTFSFLTPKFIKKIIDKQFKPLSEIERMQEGGAHFDLIRASVNLVVASVLIASATSLKLPLSTTYVTFMVAMGSSLSDRAWGRESAVYRVSGVMHVIGGWFLTAFVALLASAIIAYVLYFGEIYGIIAMLIILFLVIYKTSKIHKLTLEKKKKKEKRVSISYNNVKETLEYLSENVSESISIVDEILHNTLQGLYNEDKKKLKKADKSLQELKEDYAMVKEGLYGVIKKNSLEDSASSHIYVLTYDLMQDIIQSLEAAVDSCSNHVKNNHKPLTNSQKINLIDIEKKLSNYLTYIKDHIKNHRYHIVAEIRMQKRSIMRDIEKLTNLQIEGIKKKEFGFKNTSLYLSILLEMKDLAAISARFTKLYDRVTRDKKLRP